jgi:PEP-CTERM motif
MIAPQHTCPIGETLIRNLLLKILVFAATALSLTAHADTIDHFTITGDFHVYTFDLPQVFSFPDQMHLIVLPDQRATGTIDGVGGQIIDVYFYSGMSFRSDSLSVSGGCYGFLLEGAPPAKLIGQSGTPGHLVDWAEITAVGSFALPNAYSKPLNPDYFYLTITPETAPSVPEPSTILLLATGSLGLVSAIHRCNQGGV